MIPILFIEDLSIEDIDRLIEKGDVFDITSKNAVLPKGSSLSRRDSFWSKDIEQPNVVREANRW